MRARNLKPSFFTNDVLAEIPALGRLLFAGLWCLADRAGRLENRPRKIKAQVLPYDDCDVDNLLMELVKRGFIICYEANGINYIQVVNFEKHQNPHVKEAPSQIPAPDEHCASTVQARCETQPKPERAGLIPDSPFLIPDSGIQGGNRHSLQDSIVVGDENPPRTVETTRAGEIAAFVREHHVPATPGNPFVQVWANGMAVTDAELLEAIQRAREQKSPPEKIPVKYLDAILRNMRAERQSPMGQAPPRPTKATAAAINARSIFKPEDSHERTVDSTAERVSDPPSQVG